MDGDEGVGGLDDCGRELEESLPAFFPNQRNEGIWGETICELIEPDTPLEEIDGREALRARHISSLSMLSALLRDVSREALVPLVSDLEKPRPVLSRSACKRT